MSYVEKGTKARKTASTLQNPSSSRSHALLTVDLTREQTADVERPFDGDGTTSSGRQDVTHNQRAGSRLHLVDLAGSESAATCGGVHRLKEGANINKSLVALGNVISALVEKGSTGSGTSKRYIPYRDSSLTWLLKDALGGNATTVMLATISPASGSYNETAHTLRFAQRAQSVVNRPVVNEDPVERLIRELRAEVARLKSLLLQKDIDQQTNVPCCCGKVQSSKDSATDPQYREEQQPFNTSRPKKFDRKDEFARSKNDSSFDVHLPIRRFNSSDSVTICEIGSSRSVRKFSSYEHLRTPDRFINNYNQAKVTELNDEEDEVVNEIDEPVFVDIPTLVAVLIKPDDSLQESSTQIEEICSDEVQEDSIDADFIEGGNEDFEGAEKIDDVDSDDRRNSVNSCNALADLEIGELHRTPSSPASVGRSGPRGKFSKQNSTDLPSSNLNVSKKFGSIDGISKKKESSILDHLQRSHTNLEKHPTLPDRGKKLNNIREIDDRKVNAKSGSIWKAIGNGGSKDHLQRKSSNESDKSLKDSNIGKPGGYNIGRKPSLENLKRKTSKDSSSSSSKDEQILISSLTRDKLLRRKNSFDQEAATIAGGVRHHTAIQRVKRADIVAAVTERLYSSRKHTEESSNMATNSASDTRSPPEGTDVKVSSGSLMTRSRLQEISRKMLMKRRRINVDTQTEEASTLRFKDTACLTDDFKVVLQDAAVLTEEHADYDVAAVATTTNRRLPVLRVKDMATLTDRRPRTSIFRCKDAESLVNDLDFDDYELHSSRNDSGILSDDAQNYAESNLSSAEMSEPEPDRRVPCTDSSTNTFLASSGRNSAVQTESGNRKVADRQKESSESRSHSHCCGLIHEIGQRAPANSPEKNVISISLPDMISITIESTNGLESRIAVTDGSDAVEEKPRLISSDKESQTEQIKNEAEGSFLKDLTETVTKKSMVFRNSLGTSSGIESKENDTKTEWDIEDPCQRQRPILKGDLTRAFVAKRQFIDYSREVMLVPPIAQQGTNIPVVDDLLQQPSSTVISECTSVNEISEEPICESCSRDFVNSFEDSKKSALIKEILVDCDYNFSDDSLDYDEDNVAKKTIVANTTDTQNCKNYESLCPPDVVAHTKKEASQSASHADSIKVDSSIDDDFDDTEMEFPKRKPAEVLDKNPIHDYKALLLGTSSYLVDTDSEEEANVKAFDQSDNIGKKKVSFSNPNSPEEITDAVADRKVLALKRNSVAVKSIIKKMKKPAVTKNLDIVQSNVEVDRSVQQKNAESTTSEEVASASKEDEDFENSRESLNDEKIGFLDEDYRNESDSVVSDEDTRTMSRRKNIFEEYLNEAMIFMRNMNSINEYMSAANTLESCGKRRRRRGGSRGKKSSTDKGHMEFRGRKVNLKDDTDEYSRQDEVVPVESYVKCLKGIERLEACIDKVGKHNQILRDRYGIDVESAGAKSSLASLSVDSEMSSVKDGVIRQCGNVFSENDVENCDKSNPSRISLPFLSSIQTEAVTKQSTLKGTERRDRIKIDEHDFDDKDDSVTPEDDLERKIFDQLMRVADFSKYRSPRQFRQIRLWKMRDLRSRSPTTYSKLRETFRQDARGILNFDEVSAAEDYLDDIRGIESSPRNFRKTKLCDQTENIGSRTSIDSEIDLEEFYDRNELPEENGNPFRIKAPIIFETKVEYPDCSIDPAKSIEAGQTFNAEEEIARKITQRSMDSLRLESPNPRFVGSLSLELKYPGSPRAKFLELLKERRRIVENSRGTNAF
ncbi:kinesin-like protein kif16b protein [Lasius niger]|uniref:Kinesin-like protein kif16b protein n=1 Tax=Lasius niger TaxID=67767 RepID=A0A0J7L937_LASNI|nr:kinesin-like protein kif16b protein [Lasius niger]